MNERIRFGEPIDPLVPHEELPFGATRNPANVPCDAPFQVYIVRSVMDKIWDHAKSLPRVECSGVLVGHPFRTFDERITFVIIVGAIRHNTNQSSVGHVTIGPREIAAAREEMEDQHRGLPGLIPVGWYHSHPGHGVFLSPHDMTIARSIYNLFWHVALVVDPRRKEAAFFRGPEGERLAGWLELHKEPASVIAIALYNRAIERWQAGNIGQARRLFSHLNKWISESKNPDPDLAHWRAKGGYRDVPSLLTQLSASNLNALSGNEVQTYAAPPISGDDIVGIAQLYQKAKDYFRSGNFLTALQMFERVKEESPSYEDVDLFIDHIQKYFLPDQQQRSILNKARRPKETRIDRKS